MATSSKKQIKQTILELVIKLFGDEYTASVDETAQGQGPDELMDEPAEEVETNAAEPSPICILQEKLKIKLTQALQGPVEKNENTKQHLTKLVKQELSFYEANTKLGPFLSRLLNSLKTIQPTSIESERVFSMSSNFCTKKRSSLGDNSLNALCFLKTYFLANAYKS